MRTRTLAYSAPPCQVGGLRLASAPLNGQNALTLGSVGARPPRLPAPVRGSARDSGLLATAMKIEGYDLLEKLGEGGMGTVWKACQVSLNRPVAIKILSSSLASNAEDIERFYAEAKLMAQLRHPGIIQVYDFNVVEGAYYFVMEFVEGLTVSELLVQKKVLPPADALGIVEATAGALQYAWDKARIIHCDIKSDNVMIDNEGVVRVADLGLARTFRRIGQKDKAVSDEVLGTPGYMSPEQIEGKTDLDCRSDIYSLGAMGYHMVTGRMLFQGNPPETIMEKQLTDTVEDPYELNPKIPKTLCALIEKMLAKKRSLRHPDWEAVLADIKRVKKGLFPHPALVDERASTVRRSAARRTSPSKRMPAVKTDAAGSPVFKIVAAAVLLAAALGLWALLRHPGRPPPSRVSQGPTPSYSPSSAEQAYQSAENWALANPDRFDEAIQRFRQIQPQVRGSEYQAVVETRLHNLEAGRRTACQRVMADLRKTAAPLVAKEEYAQAAAIYENYSGRHAAESRAERLAAAKDLRNRRTANPERTVQAADQVLDDLARAVIADGAAKGKDLLSQALGRMAWGDQRKTLTEIRGILERAAAIESRILASFESQVGQEIAVDLADGRKTLAVVQVDAGKIVFREGGASGTTRAVAANELALQERLRRMGPDSIPEVALAKGLMAMEYGAKAKAREYFEKLPAPLSDRLLAAAGK